MIAQFDGICAECGHSIHEGDEITAHNDGWQHAHCSSAPKRLHPVCDACWLTHAPGHCDRDD